MVSALRMSFYSKYKRAEIPSSRISFTVDPSLPTIVLMENLAGKKALIVGLGKSGAAAARYLVGQGAQVTVTDLKKPEELKTYLDSCADLPLTYELGHHQKETFLGSQLIVLSPGVSRQQPLVAQAAAAGIVLTNEPNLALQKITAPVIAVTGSAGKTTTCTLIARMLEAGGKKVFLGGNIGNPLLNLVMSGEKVDFVVAELSSFQLELVESFTPYAVVYTPIAQDHLDRYKSMEEYVSAKERLAEFCTSSSIAIFSFENSWHAQIAASTRGNILWYATEEPQGMRGAYYNRADRRIEMLSNKLSMRACPAGDKNIQNIMAAAMMALLTGVPIESIQATINGFSGIAHRMEFVRRREGVTFFNDSKATNVISVLNALNQFEDNSVVLLAGGKNKAIDFSPLCESVHRKCKLVVSGIL